MPPAEYPVTFQPLGRTVRVPAQTRLLEAAAEAGAVLDLPCGGEGVCGKCRVRIRQGVAEPGPADRRAIGQDDLRQGFRLACQQSVAGPMTVEVPETSLLASYHQILAHLNGTAEAPPADADPVVRKVYLEMLPPDREHDEPDLARLEEVAGRVDVELDLLRRLPGLLRKAEFRGTAVLDRSAAAASPALLDFEPGNTAADGFAVAFDIGTTTLVAMLLDLRTGQEAAIASRLNPQTGLGDDVLTRILHTERNPDGLQQLHQSVTAAADEMVGQLVGQAGIDRGRIYLATMAGNTTMQQLLAGIDPRWLGEVPFVPATRDPIIVRASQLGLNLHPRAMAYLLPVIGGFVGGDTVAGILATDLASARGPTLLVDIGTNGEIVLSASGKLLAASTAAGPAFEEARITHGMRGSRGAIERVAVDGRLVTQTIGGVPPIGLCGSGLIDLVAELLRQGMLGAEGRMKSPDDLPAELANDLRRRAVSADGKPAFLLADERESGTGLPIVFTQRDVRELQLASGAIRAGIGVLLRRCGLAAADLDAVWIAGGFGNYIRRTNAQRIGLLPPEIPRDRIRYQGNTSLAGARFTALSAAARRQAQDLARRTEHVDLSRDPQFSWTFAEAMLFPGG